MWMKACVSVCEFAWNTKSLICMERMIYVKMNEIVICEWNELQQGFSVKQMIVRFFGEGD